MGIQEVYVSQCDHNFHLNISCSLLFICWYLWSLQQVYQRQLHHVFLNAIIFDMFRLTSIYPLGSFTLLLGIIIVIQLLHILTTVHQEINVLLVSN